MTMKCIFNYSTEGVLNQTHTTEFLPTTIFNNTYHYDDGGYSYKIDEAHKYWYRGDHTDRRGEPTLFIGNFTEILYIPFYT